MTEKLLSRCGYHKEAGDLDSVQQFTSAECSSASYCYSKMVSDARVEHLFELTFVKPDFVYFYVATDNLSYCKM